MGSGQNNKPAGTDRLIGQDKGDNGMKKVNPSSQKSSEGQYSGVVDPTKNNQRDPNYKKDK
ncbi:hypothetical protein [Bdellovibrio sp. HCB274]|uniref:hypothetical protein n=1 Tax=Bdellovibrio sp. HCB274 TaxID=3394361 RepID=UPI0039B490FD